MIQKLRRRHRWIFVLLLLVLPLLFVLSLAARKPTAPSEDLPSKLFSELKAPGAARWKETVDGLVFVLHEGVPPLLSVTANEDPMIPDPLLYWSPAAFSGELPDADAILLGALGSEGQRIFRLPAGAEQGSGVLCVFSPARRQILVQLTLPGDGL